LRQTAKRRAGEAYAGRYRGSIEVNARVIKKAALHCCKVAKRPDENPVACGLRVIGATCNLQLDGLQTVGHQPT